MTTDDILRMAEEADALADKEIAMPGEHHPDWHDVRDRHFAALVAAAERDECAKVCKDEMIDEEQCNDDVAYNAGCNDCAAAIRARGTK